MRLQRGDVGARVVVRHRLADGRATDVIGQLVACDEDMVTVRPAGGPDVRVPLADVVASRVVGQRRGSGAAGPAAAHVGDDDRGGAAGGAAAGPLATSVAVAAARTGLGWSGRDVEPLGDWVLRSGPARMMRGRSALATGDPGIPLPDALDAVTDHYRSIGLPPAVQVSSPLPPHGAGPGGRHDADAGTDEGPAGLEALLAGAGWEPRPWTVLALRPTAPPSPPRPTPPSVTVRPSPDPAWLAASDHHGAPLTLADLPPERDGVALAYASVHAEEHGVVGVARGALAERWLGITCVTVDVAHRRRGLAGGLLAGLEDALRQGADASYVQVEADNRGARAAWRSAGFTDHSRYRFWTLPHPT